jgi:Fe2+ transport system protein FeoA
MLPRREAVREIATNGSGPLSLVGARRNDRVRVVRVAGHPSLIQRLAALGIVPGVVLTVLKPASPLIVSMGGSRIAIGDGAGRYVEIEVV